ncbi:FimB/Mfa2 family fimbrial subunit [Bacteroides ilei]|uniref:FimB/Mfa2 family fimbrial subunit n=1 Tax=Bacteroides ilei TaxID=1907658 RepID=UPI000AE319B6|nr:FimB/Mfa2 family fimbrial subunit [Bacteroides ilei]
MTLTVCGFLLLGASCSKDDEPVQTVEGVTVTISAQSDLQTRTTLPVYDGKDTDGKPIYGTKIDGVQHVTDVYLYVFEKNSGSGDYVCKSMQDVHWSERIDRDENGKLPITTSKLSYTISYKFDKNCIYRLVAVGIDNAKSNEEMQDYDGWNSILTYGLPDSIRTGSKLTDPITLQEGKTPTDMAHSEFFTGYIDYNPLTQGTNLGIIDLWRRVAGLQVCLNQIPKEVERVRILLYNSQNTQVKLLPSAPQESETDKKIITDFITSPYGNDSFNEEGRVLMDKTFTEDDLYLPGSSKGVVSDYAYKCSLTAFMLPVNIPDRELYDHTLVAEFITTSITGIVGTSKKVRLNLQNGNNLVFEDETDIGTGIIDDLDKYLFPIQANHFYCLGTPSNPIDCSKVLN